MKELIIATRNEKKFKEIKRLFSGSKIRILSLKRFSGIPEVVEDGRTFKDNAAKKAVVVSRHINRLVLSDDSGLEVDALNGRPGVHSSRYAGPSKDDRLNISKLLKALKDVPNSRRKARFKCAIAMAERGRLIRLVMATCEGTIACATDGNTGFGYDPVFIPKGYKRSFARLGHKTKDRLSHRSKALKKARKAIEVYFAEGL